VILWGNKGKIAPPDLYVKKGLDSGPLIIYATQCLTPVLVQLPILYKKNTEKMTVFNRLIFITHM
jgi:hypothetical protein